MTAVDPDLQKFLTENSFEKRQSVVQNILTRYPERVPVIISRGDLKHTPSISKYKYLVPNDLMFGKFTFELRTNMAKIDSSMALFFFLKNNTLIPSTAFMSSLYNKHKSEDGFLYITYSSENTFG